MEITWIKSWYQCVLNSTSNSTIYWLWKFSSYLTFNYLIFLCDKRIAAFCYNAFISIEITQFMWSMNLLQNLVKNIFYEKISMDFRIFTLKYMFPFSHELLEIFSYFWCMLIFSSQYVLLLSYEGNLKGNQDVFTARFNFSKNNESIWWQML